MTLNASTTNRISSRPTLLIALSGSAVSIITMVLVLTIIDTTFIAIPHHSVVSVMVGAMGTALGFSIVENLRTRFAIQVDIRREAIAFLLAAAASAGAYVTISSTSGARDISQGLCILGGALATAAVFAGISTLLSQTPKNIGQL